MVVTRVFAAGVALAALALVAAAPIARADDSLSKNNNGNFLRIDPTSAHGGQSVRIEARCNSNNVDLITSGALTDVRAWIRASRRDVNIETSAKVRSDVQSGEFEVSFHCGQQRISVKIMVNNGGGQTTTTAPPTTTTTSGNTTTATDTTTGAIPSGAPQTGGEGPSDDGSGLLGLAELGGLVLIAGGGVGVAVLSRRRRLSSELG